MALPRRHRERRPALVTTVICIGGVPKQRLADQGMALSSSHQKWCGPVLAECVDIRLHGEKVAADIRMANVAGLVQRSVAISTLGVEVRTLFYEELQDRGPAAVR